MKRMVQIFGYFGLAMLVSLISLWLTNRMAPAQNSEFINEESTDRSFEVQKSIPIFYFSLLPTINEPKLSFRNFIPEWRWNGVENQFHQLITVRSLRSNVTDELVAQRVLHSLKWTMAIQIPSLIILFFSSFFLSFWISKRHNKIGKLVFQLLVFFHSVPLFWLASCLVLLFSVAINLLPASMVSFIHSPWSDVLMSSPQYFILPIVCSVLPSLAFLTGLMVDTQFQIRDEVFWTRALSQGLQEHQLRQFELKSHLLLRISAWFAGAIPSIIGGSLIIENVFVIPGMGRLLVQALKTSDWNTVNFIVFLTAVLSCIGFFISDLLISKIDPRQ